MKTQAVQFGDGPVSYNSKVGSCLEERLDSKGLFGMFKDNTRCGTAGKNFYPKK